MATTAGVARRMSASPSSSAAGSGGVGALALANFIAPGAPKTTVDVANLLAQASLDGLAYQLQAESEVFVLLVEELARAKAALPPRGVVTFVNLTAKGCLPLWVPAESTGGRAAVANDCEMLAGASGTATLSQLGAASRGATAAPRFFRSMAQWCGAWTRFGTAAVVAGQWTLPQGIARLDAVLRLSEQERASGGMMFTALVYDELVRCSWEQRAFRIFPLVGRLPPAGYASQPTKAKARCGDDMKLLEDLQVWNEEVLREREARAIRGGHCEGAKECSPGAMSEPCGWRPEHREFLLMGRLPVRDDKTEKYETRVADRGTECGAYRHTLPSDTMTHDTCEVLVEIELTFMKKRRAPLRKLKRDVKRAFKRVLIAKRHFMHMFRQVLAVPAGSFVDDIFGVDDERSRVTGGMCGDVVCNLLGATMDPVKAVVTWQSLVVLGALVRDVPDRGIVTIQVSEDKVREWSKQLEDCSAAGRGEAGLGAKFAGRLSFAVTLAAVKAGRAFIAPGYAQQHDTLPEGRFSWRWRYVAVVDEYLRYRPPAVRSLSDDQRPCIGFWTDAAGRSRRIAAVVRLNGADFYTHMRVTDEIWDSLLDRNDEQVGFQEALAVFLFIGTFESVCARGRLLGFVDNDGVRASLEMLDLARRGTAVFLARVETHANIADGSSRARLVLMKRLRATYVEPVLPPWAFGLWSWP